MHSEKMSKLEKYKKRFSRSLEEGITQAQRPGSFKQSADKLFREKGKFEKFQAMVGLISELLPKSALACAKDKYAYDFRSFPVDEGEFAVNPEKIAIGGSDKVFHLESKSDDAPSYALKINYKIKGNSGDIAAVARKQMDEYATIKDRYRDIPGLIPKEHTLVVSDPKSGEPAMATIQEFFGKYLINVMDRRNRREVVKILTEDEELYQNLAKFVQITLGAASSQGNIVDLGGFGGKGNFVIANDKEKKRLVFLDSHPLFSSPSRSSRTNKNTLEHLNYLTDICKEASMRK